MKKILILLMLLFCTALVQAQTASINTASPSLSEARKIGAEIVKLFNRQKYEEALPLAQKVLAITLEQLGADNPETAQAYANLGYLQVARDKKTEAAAAFESALLIYDKKPNLEKKDALALARILETLGYLKFNRGREGNSEKLYQRALNLREKHSGAESKDTINTVLSLANLNHFVGDYKQAVSLYRRVLEFRVKQSGKNNGETIDAFERCRCALTKIGKDDEAETLTEQFAPKINEPGADKFKDGEPTSVQKGEISNAATYLAKPAYPEIAKRFAAEGTVNVRVIIDKTGKTVFACAANSKLHPSLIQVSEAAAYQSKFTPLTLDGTPVTFTGTVFYKFSKRSFVVW